MFINHYDLRKLVTSLSIAFKDNEIKNFIEKLITFKAINSVIDHIYIEKIKNEYKIYFFEHLLSSFSSDFDYTINTNEGKIRLLKFVLYKDFPALVPVFLKILLNYNCNILDSSDEKLSTKSRVINVDLSKRNKFNEEIDTVDCKMEFDVYSSSNLIGNYGYRGDCYIRNSCKTYDDICKSIENVSDVDDKKTLKKCMKISNYWYFKNNIEKNLTNRNCKKI